MSAAPPGPGGLAAATVEPAPPRRGLLRRLLTLLLRVLLVLVALLLVARMTHPLWLPSVVARAGAAAGLDVRYGDLDLRILAGDVELRDLTVRAATPEADGADLGDAVPVQPRQLLEVDYLAADLSMRDLLTGGLRLRRVSVGRAEVTLERDTDGSWNLGDLAADDGDDGVDEGTDAAPDGPVDFRLPVALDRLDLAALAVTVDDRLEERLLFVEAGVEATDLGNADTPGRLLLDARAPGLFADLRLTADLEQPEVRPEGLAEDARAPRGLALAFDGRLVDLDHHAVAAWVPTLGAMAEELDGRLAGRATLRPTDLAGAARAEVELDGFRIGALGGAGSSGIGLAALRLSHDLVPGAPLRIGPAVVEGLELELGRSPGGRPQVLGFELLEAVAGSVAEEVVAATEEATADAPAGEPLVLPELAGLELRDASLRVHDAVTGVDLTLGLALLALAPAEDADGGPAIDLTVELGAPGVFDELTLDGRLPLAGLTGAREELVAAFRGALRARGLDPVALAPVLEAAGLAWVAGPTDLTLDLDGEVTILPDGGLRAGLTMDRLALGGATPLLGFERLALTGLALSPEGDVDVGTLELTGPTLVAGRTADGLLEVAGLRLVGEARGGAPEPVAGRTGAAADGARGGPAGTPTAAPRPLLDPAALPRVTLGSLAITDAGLTFTDMAGEAPLRLAPELSVELRDLDLSGERRMDAPFRLRLAQPGLVDELQVTGNLEGELDAGGGRYDLALTLAGTGLATTLFEDRLAAAGLTGSLTGGAADARLGATLVLDPAAPPLLDLDLAARLRGDDDATVLELHDLTFDGLVLAAGEVLELPKVRLEGPAVGLHRDAAGRLTLAGLGYEPPPPAPPAPPTERLDPDADLAEADAGGVPALPALRWAGLDLANVSLAVTEGDVRRTLELDLEVGPLDLVDPAPVDVELLLRAQQSGTGDAVVPADLALFGLQAELLPDPAAPSLAGGLELRAGERGLLGALLPPGLELTAGQASLGLTFAASADLADPADPAVQVEVGDLALVDRAAGAGAVPLLALERAALDLPHLSDARVELAEAAVEGLALDVRRAADGTLHLPGLALVGGEPTPTVAAGPALAVGAPGVAPAGEPDAPWRPILALGRVVLELERLGFVDEAAGGVPLDLSLALETLAPFERDLDADPPETDGAGEAPAPLRLALTAGAVPGVERVRVDLAVDPFAADPQLVAGLDVTGVSGAGLTAALPALAKALDLSGVDGGRLSADLDAALALRRRGPLDFDPAGGLAGDLELVGLAWAPTADGPPVLGLDRLAAELTRADADGVVLATVELDRPFGALAMTSEGLRVAGLLVPVASPDPERGVVAEGGGDASGSSADALATVDDPATEVRAQGGGAADPTAADGEPAGLAELRAGPASPSTGEESAPVGPSPAPTDLADAGDPTAIDAPAPPFPVTVRELTVSGLDLVVRDDRVDPPMVLPLDDLEVEVRGLSSLATVEPVPVTFNAYLGAGEIELEERHEGNVVTGLLGAVGGVLAGREDRFELEPRQAFGGVDLAGRVTLVPAPTGWVRLEAGGVELPNYRGIVAASGVELGDGLLDVELDLRLLGERGAAVTTSARAEHLSLSEPPGGPISTYLQLPAPLDTVLYLLRDEDGAQVLPLSFHLAPDGGPEGLASAVAATLGTLIGEAIASSPMRLVGGVLDLTGLVEDEVVELPDELVGVGFLPGSAEQTSWPLLGGAEPLLAALRADPDLRLDLTHVFTGADLERLGTLVRPDPAACRTLAERLRRERDAAIASRDRLAVELRTDYALGVIGGREAKHRALADLDAELALLEDSLDGVLAYLRAGSERRAERRARAAALLVAEQRLEAVRAAVVALPIPSVGERVRVRRARLGELVEAEAGGSVYLLPKR